MNVYLGQLGDLEQVTVRVSEERSDLTAAIEGWSEKLCSTGTQKLVAVVAIGDSKDDLAVHSIGVRRWRKRHGRLLWGRFAAGDEQQPVPEQIEHHRGAPILAEHRGVEDLDVPVAAGRCIGHDQHVSECICLESLHKRTLPRLSSEGCSYCVSQAIDPTDASCEAGARSHRQFVVGLVTLSGASPVSAADLSHGIGVVLRGSAS